jgi:hypothetical protein
MFKPGFSGNDSMRSNAEKMFAHELRAADHPAQTMSMSSPGRTNMRPFKNGGHAIEGNPAPRHHAAKVMGGSTPKTHAMSKEQTDLHIPTRAKTPAMKTVKFEDAEHLKKGGVARHPTRRVHMMKKGEGHLKHCYASGGPVKAGHDNLRGSKGGDTHWPMKGEHGVKVKSVKLKAGGHLKRFNAGGYADPQGPSVSQTMGGNSKSGSGNLRGSMGGDTHWPMRGEHGVKVKPVKLAAGGVAKIRHGEATLSGKPKPLKKIKSC